jgi:hypothetical protein
MEKIIEIKARKAHVDHIIFMIDMLSGMSLDEDDHPTIKKRIKSLDRMLKNNGLKRKYN